MEKVRIGTFTPSVLLEVAKRTGRLEAAGIVVLEESVPSSPSQFESLREGRFDAIVTSPDNVLANCFLQANPLGERLDLVVTAALDSDAGLALCLRPGMIEPAAPLRLGVDVPTSGFAFAAYGLLEQAGLARDEYEVVTLGSSPNRARALIDGECDATILGAGNELTAVSSGATIHSRVTALGPYIGEVLARERMGVNAAAADALADALIDTAQAIRAGEFAEQTVAAVESLLGLPTELAKAHHTRLATTGLIDGGAVSLDAISTLVELRARYLPEPDLDHVMPSVERILLDRLRA